MSKRATPLKKPEIILDQHASVPLYKQLYQRLRASILEGHLQAGTRLPSTRAFASSLGVSRITTALAFQQQELEGYIQSRVGDGTRVAPLQSAYLVQASRNVPELETSAPRETPPAGPGQRGQVLIDMPYPEGFYDHGSSLASSLFRVGQPDVTGFLYEIWARLLARHARQSLQAVSFYQVCPSAPGHRHPHRRDARC
jgi:GntR family transcriptional regulator / MocR family aminotransferase